MSYTYEVEEYSQDTRHFTIQSDVKLTEQQINIAICEVDLKDGATNTFTLEDIDDDVLTPKNKSNIKVTFNYTEYGDDAHVNIEGYTEKE